MKTELRQQILKRIKSDELKSFTCFDFTDFASYKTVSKCLERLEDEKLLYRIGMGIYCLNQYDDVLKIQILPSIDNVVHTIAKKNNWTICPTGNAALNMMGLSTQVVASFTYLTSGPYKEYLILNNKICLKRTMGRELIGHSLKTNLLIQSIKALGKENITQENIDVLSSKLTLKEKEKAVQETPLIQTWIRKIVLKVCEVR